MLFYPGHVPLGGWYVWKTLAGSCAKIQAIFLISELAQTAYCTPTNGAAVSNSVPNLHFVFVLDTTDLVARFGVCFSELLNYSFSKIGNRNYVFLS